MHITEKKYSAFTLVEIIVAITIFGIIMISVLTIFLYASQMSGRIEITRSMQENLKHVTEEIAEGVRKYGIEGVNGTINPDECSSQGATTTSYKLCLNNGNIYVLGFRDGDNWKAADSTNITSCRISSSSTSTVRDCRILRKNAGEYLPVTNNSIAFESLRFIVTGENPKKLVFHASVRPSLSSGLQIPVIQNNRMHIQTIFSERLIQTQ